MVAQHEEMPVKTLLEAVSTSAVLQVGIGDTYTSQMSSKRYNVDSCDVSMGAVISEM